jgi:transketolase
MANEARSTCDVIEDLERQAMLLRAHEMVAIYAAGSGHPGGSLSIADVTAVLFLHEARLDPKNPRWPGRDRIFFSAGHKAPALYTGLALAGFIAMDEVLTLRRFDSICQGHPHSLKCPGVEISSGSLGQGLGVAVGAALGLRLEGGDNRVYCIMGDGEQQEGSVWEAAMAAGHYRLDNLVAIVDFNRLQIDGEVESVMNIRPLADKYRAFGWNALECDGHSIPALLEAFQAARACKGKPTVLIAHTTKGKGVSFMENVAAWHGVAPKTREQLDQALADILGREVWSRDEVDAMLAKAEAFSAAKAPQVEAAFPAVGGCWWNDGDDMRVDMFPTRQGFGRALDLIGDDPRIVTLHVDISGSICIDQFEKNHPERLPRVFSLGIAEQNMVQVAAGLATTGRIPVAGDYGVFACGRCWDQLRTSVCYPNLNVKIAGAHAGVSVGADGATHQALEEIALLATLPNMTLLVPCDSLETEKMTRIGILEVAGPTYIRYAREATPIVTRPETPCVLGKANVIRYRGRAPKFVDAFETVVADAYTSEKEDVALVACGPILPEAMRAAYILREKHALEARVINMHTVKPLDEAAILAAVNDIGLIVTAEEHQIGGFGNLVAGVAARHKARRKPLKMDMIGIEDRFGESGEPWELMKVFHLTAEHIVRKALALANSK